MTEAAELSTTEKRNRIDVELRTDPNRSDREIARVIGCDHKTVGAARERLGIASPLGNFQSGLSPREQLLRKTFPPDIDPDSPAFQADLAKIDRIADAEAAREALGMNDDETEREFYWAIPRQHAIECRALAGGDVEIWQEGQHGDDDASIVRVAAGNVVMLARHLLYAAGFKSITIATHVPGEGMEDVEDGSLAATFYPDEAKR